MKKTIFLTALLLVAATLSSVANDKSTRTRAEDPKAAITTLTVNADVTIILVNSDDQIKMTGDEAFMSHVSFRQNGNVLVVKSNRNRNYRGRGIIYVPATNLANIEVNSAADIKSAGVLNIPELKVQVNGDCKVHVFTNGKVRPESDSFEIEYHARNLFEIDPLAFKR